MTFSTPTSVKLRAAKVVLTGKQLEPSFSSLPSCEMKIRFMLSTIRGFGQGVGERADDKLQRVQRIRIVVVNACFNMGVLSKSLN